MQDAGGANPYSPKSNFEGYDHAALKAMVHRADAGSVIDVGTRLTNAHTVMDSIGNELMSHMSNLDWAGDAADSFREWGRQVAKATLELSEYSRVAGDFMTNAGSTLCDVKKAIPDVPAKDMETVARHRAQPSAATAITGTVVGAALAGPLGAAAGPSVADRAMKAVNPDWVTASEAAAAQKRIDVAHQQAIAQMEKLGQSYEMSTDVMKSAKTPTFPPTPETLMPPRRYAEDGITDVNVGGAGSTGSSGSRTGGGGTVRGSSGVTGGASITHSGGGGSVTGDVRTPHTTPVTGGTGSHVGTGIDGVAVLPTSPSGSTPLPGGGQGTAPGGTAVPPTGGLPGGGLLPGGGRLGGSPGSGGVRVPGGRPVAGGGLRPGGKAVGGVFGEGEPGLGAGAGSRRPGYGGTTVGAEEGAGTTGSARTGAGAGRGGAVARRPAGGAAFDGLEEGHGAAGGTGAGGAGGRGYRGGQGSAGRRLATEEGGMVGGRRGPGAGGEFTPGGSGLRNRGAAGADPDGHGMPVGSAAGGRSSRERRGRRPDYLVEDEETWGSSASESNPTVIE
ncbi:WXG100 family type VII secretion target [Streptomyces sp. NPDC001380]|uniref:WXG100 family type VII secretion target n=1 Tax=Streptomyces sp. NPDC001380 TaxID=3364566 RepID=UPI00368DD3B5